MFGSGSIIALGQLIIMVASGPTRRSILEELWTSARYKTLDVDNVLENTLLDVKNIDRDTFGTALLDFLEGKDAPDLVLEAGDEPYRPCIRSGSSADSSSGNGGIENSYPGRAWSGTRSWGGSRTSCLVHAGAWDAGDGSLTVVGPERFQW